MGRYRTGSLEIGLWVNLTSARTHALIRKDAIEIATDV